MTANTELIQVIADPLIGEYEEEATEWLEDGGRANIERIVTEWCAAIEEGRWVERLEDVLVLRALRHEEHWVTVLGGPNTEALIRELVDDDWRARGVKTAARIGEVFAHELLRGDTGEPFESIEYDWREHGSAVRGEDDEQPWNAATPLSGTVSPPPPRSRMPARPPKAPRTATARAPRSTRRARPLRSRRTVEARARTVPPIRRPPTPSTR